MCNLCAPNKFASPLGDANGDGEVTCVFHAPVTFSRQKRPPTFPPH
jgi:hypothetical protein